MAEQSPPRRLRRPPICVLMHNQGWALLWLIPFAGIGVGIIQEPTDVVPWLFVVISSPIYIGWATSAVVLHHDRLVTGSILRKREYLFADVLSVQEGRVFFFRGFVKGIEFRYADNQYDAVDASAGLGELRSVWITEISRAVTRHQDVHGEPEISKEEFARNVNNDRLRELVRSLCHGSDEYLLRRLKDEGATALTSAKLLHQVKGGNLAEWRALVASSEAYSSELNGREVTGG